jgi:hypothetical protein
MQADIVAQSKYASGEQVEGEPTLVMSPQNAGSPEMADQSQTLIDKDSIAIDMGMRPNTASSPNTFQYNQ